MRTHNNDIDTDDDEQQNAPHPNHGQHGAHDEDDEDQDETMRERSPLVQLTDDKVRNKRTSSGSYRQVLPERQKPAAEASTSTTPSLMLMAIDGTRHQRATPPVSSSRTTINEEDEDEGARYGAHSERASVLDDNARRHKRVHRRRLSTSSYSSADDPERSRTPSPILGDAYPYAGAASRPGHLGPPTPGPSAADIHALLYDSHNGSAEGSQDAPRRPSVLPDSSEISAIIAKVEDMGFKEADLPGLAAAQGQSREAELANMVHKLGQHALEQDAYIRSMEESLHNTRVTAMSVISSLTTSHAYDIAYERQLRDRLEVELEGTQAQARMLSAMLAKAQNRNSEFDRERAMSVEEEMRWAATLPAGSRKVSGGSSATITAASPRTTTERTQQGPAGSPTPAGPPHSTGQAAQGEGSSTAPKQEPSTIGLGVLGTPGMPQSEYTDILDSPMSAVITERNKLASDKKYLRTRVRDAEAQLHRLENELKALRPLLVHGGARALMATSGPSVPNTPSHHNLASSVYQTPSRSRNRSQRRRKMITMGDAEAEHLLLAARRLNHHRSMGSLPTFSEYSSPHKATSSRFQPGDRPRTPPPRSMDGPPRTPGTAGTATARTVPRSTGGKSRSSLMDSLLINGAPGTSTGSPPTRNKPLSAQHARLDSNASIASFNGMEELIHAAESVLTPRDRLVNSKGQEAAPGVHPSSSGAGAYFPPVKGSGPSGVTGGIFDNHHLAHDSPKRRRVSVTALDNERPRIFSASPQTRHLPGMHKPFPTNANARRLRTRTEGADVPGQGPSPQPAFQGLRGNNGRDADETGSVGPLSALDLLADQAAASQNPSQSSEPSVSDGEKRDGFSSQEEGPSREDEREEARFRSGGAYPHHTTPRGGTSSSLAARARVSAAPLAYAHSIAPTPDYAQPRYAHPSHSHGPPGGLPPPGSMSSPNTPHHHLQSLPPMNDAYAPRGVNSTGHLGPGPVPSGYLNNNLPPINTALAHHHHHPPGPQTHVGHGHPMHGPPPHMGPMSASPGGHHVSHGHHHSLPGMSALTNGYQGGPPPPQGAPGLGSPLSSPITGGYPTPRHHKSSTSLDSNAHMVGGIPPYVGHQGPPQVPLPPPSAGNGGSSSGGSGSSSKAPKPKGGNTSPDKRLPYVRWTSDEDAKLKSAISHYGQRWEAVAKAVGSRTYHQCRQRALLMRRKGMDPGFNGGRRRSRSRDDHGTASAESGASAVDEGEAEEVDEVDDETASMATQAE